jgi:hypothetical protein
MIIGDQNAWHAAIIADPGAEGQSANAFPGHAGPIRRGAKLVSCRPILLWASAWSTVWQPALGETSELTLTVTGHRRYSFEIVVMLAP